MVDVGLEELEVAGTRTDSILDALMMSTGEPTQLHTSLEASFTDSYENVDCSRTPATKILSDNCFEYRKDLSYSGSKVEDFMKTENEGDSENIQLAASDLVLTAQNEEVQTEEIHQIHQEEYFLPTHQIPLVTEKDHDASRNRKCSEGDLFSHNNSKINLTHEHPISEDEATCSTETLVTKSKLSSQNILETCYELIPAMKKVTPQNFGEFLVEVLREISDEFTPEELYTLLYPKLRPVAFGRAYKFEIPQFVSNLTGSKALKLFSFIAKAFELSHMSTSDNEPESMKSILLAPVKFEEFKRTLFAIKILLDSFKTDNSSSMTANAISRKAVYKVYCEVSRKMAANFKKTIKGSCMRRKSTVVGIAQFGKLIKLVYPDLMIRRLGKRGHSESYYLGLDWNRSIIGDDMILELGLALPIKARRSRTHQKSNKDGKNIRKHGTDLEESFERTSIKTNGSPYSFVDSHSKFPGGMCQPRIWKHSTGNVPQQSCWSRITLMKSVKCLKSYKVDVWPVVLDFHRNIFLNGFQHVLSTDFIKQMNILISGKSDEKGYMHLFLTILLLLFPVILASNKEVDLEDKVQLRKNLGYFINKISLERFDLPKAESNYLKNFLNIIRKMIHVNVMTSSQVKTGLAERIIEKVSLGLERRKSFDVCDQTVLEELISNAVIIASNAYRPAFAHAQKGRNGEKTFLSKVIDAFLNFAKSVNQSFIEFSRSSRSQDKFVTYDFPYQLFRISSKSFHQICLSDPLIKDLPINVIHFVNFQIHKEIQNASFNAFALQDHQLSKETFKTWWIYSTLAEEYCIILAEIVALSEKLKG